MPSLRLDQALVERGLASSRSKAQALISDGCVLLNGSAVRKASQKVQEDSHLSITGPNDDWVGRGALKLSAALEYFQIDPANMIAADIGASTGGFCEVLLRQNVRKIYAVDVGRDQLHPRIKNDPRVIDLSGVNAKGITADVIPDQLNLVVSDVSFISLKKALPATLQLCLNGAVLLALVKPQFEAGREHIGKGGIVRNEQIQEQVRADLANWINTQPGWQSLGTTKSPITGSDGNQEFLLGARYDG